MRPGRVWAAARATDLCERREQRSALAPRHRRRAAGTPASYPNVPFSLVVRTDNGSGIKQLQPLGASELAPALPKVLAPRATWRGSFAGSEVLKKGTLFYVGIGQFFYVNAPYDPLPIALTTQESA